MSVTPEVTVVEADEVQVVRVLEPGSVWLTGDGAPASSLGKVGDLYLDELTGDVYGPKTTSGWGAVSFTLVPTEFNKIGFDLDAAETVSTGELAWNADEATLELGKVGGISNYLGQETMVLCRNNSNTIEIPKGTAVMFAGAVGASGRIKVAPMVANGAHPGYVFFGVTDQSIAGGGDGYVTTFGKIRGINTSAYVDGDILWCNPSTPGGFTKVEPQAPNLKLAVAAVISAGSNGTILVRATSGARLQDLHDVEANGAKDNLDVLNWNATANRWEPTDRLTSLEQRVTAIENALP